LFSGCDPAQPVITRELKHIFHVATNRADIDKKASVQTLRHSFATHLLDQKIDICVIEVLLGHAKINTAALYTRATTSSIRQVRNPVDRIAQGSSASIVPPPG